MNSNTNLPLFQWVDGKWLPNPVLASTSKLSPKKQKREKRKKRTTEEIQAFTNLPTHQLPRIGEYLLLVHQGRNNWQVYQEKSV